MINNVKKKAVTVALVGALTFGSVGGTVFAYESGWADQIKHGVSLLADSIFGTKFATTIDAKGNELEKDLDAKANTLINGTISDLNSFHQSEVQRGIEALQSKYDYDVEKLETVLNSSVEAEKAEQQKENNVAIEKAKNEMDAIIEGYLNQIPQ